MRNYYSNNTLIVVMYHEIMEQCSKILGDSLCVSLDNFKEHLSFYKKYFEIIFPEEIFNFTLSNKPKMIITFDDGYIGNYKYVYPLLKEKNIKGIFFITEKFISNEACNWSLCLKQLKFEEIFYFLYKIKKLYLLFIWIKYKYNGLKRFLSYKDIKTLSYLCLYKFSIKKQQFMSLSQIKEIIKNTNLIKIGGHTFYHPILSNLTYNEQLFEIKESIMKLEEKIGIKINSFAYPFGKNKDFNQISTKILKEEYFSFTTIKGINNLYSLDKNKIHRFNIQNISGVYLKEFFKKEGIFYENFLSKTT